MPLEELVSADPYQSNYCAFSCPQEKMDMAFFQGLVTVHAQQTVALFMERFTSHLRSVGHGVSAHINQWLDSSDISCDMAWDLSIGCAWGSYRSGSQSQAAHDAAMLALWLGSCGISGNWELRLNQPAHLRWAGWLLPKASHITMQSNGNEAHLGLTLGNKTNKVHLWRQNHFWEGDGARALPQFGSPNRKIIVLTLPALSKSRFENLLPDVNTHEDKKAVAMCQAATDLLDEHARPYLFWVTRIMRYVILLKYEKERIRSGSVKDEYGLCHMSICDNPIPIAEMLVHESSHHYFHLISRLGKVDDGTDTKEYYSPVVGKKRPLSRILLAYHAFANVLLLYRICLDKGIPDEGYCSRNLKMLSEQLRQLEAPLRNNPALTPVGRALCEPLMKRINLQGP